MTRDLSKCAEWFSLCHLYFSNCNDKKAVELSTSVLVHLGLFSSSVSSFAKCGEDYKISKVLLSSDILLLNHNLNLQSNWDSNYLHNKKNLILEYIYNKRINPQDWREFKGSLSNWRTHPVTNSYTPNLPQTPSFNLKYPGRHLISVQTHLHRNLI